jgi:hypothetical protein
MCRPQTLRRAPFDACGHRLETKLVVQIAEDWLRDDSMTSRI